MNDVLVHIFGFELVCLIYFGQVCITTVLKGLPLQCKHCHCNENIFNWRIWPPPCQYFHHSENIWKCEIKLNMFNELAGRSHHNAPNVYIHKCFSLFLQQTFLQMIKNILFPKLHDSFLLSLIPLLMKASLSYIISLSPPLTIGGHEILMEQ